MAPSRDPRQRPAVPLADVPAGVRLGPDSPLRQVRKAAARLRQLAAGAVGDGWLDETCAWYEDRGEGEFRRQYPAVKILGQRPKQGLLARVVGGAPPDRAGTMAPDGLSLLVDVKSIGGDAVSFLLAPKYRHQVVAMQSVDRCGGVAAFLLYAPADRRVWLLGRDHFAVLASGGRVTFAARERGRVVRDLVPVVHERIVPNRPPLDWLPALHRLYIG